MVLGLFKKIINTAAASSSISAPTVPVEKVYEREVWHLTFVLFDLKRSSEPL